MAKSTCMEAAIGGPPDTYIPCGKPAVKIVGWKGRSDAPLPMCLECAYHNVKHRSGVIRAEVIRED